MLKSVMRGHPEMVGGEAPVPASFTRQHVTLLFSDLCGFTRLSESIDPELVREIMHRIKSAADTILREHVGLLNQDYGDGIMAIFGFPAAQEDDARRAAEAALQLHREIPRLPRIEPLLPPAFELAMHSGIHSGLVVVGVGDPIQGRYELTGDAVNVAMRLCETAGRGQIYVSEGTLRGAAEFFVTQPLGSLQLKGRHERIKVWAVKERSNVMTRYQARVRHGLTEFIGRQPEMQYLKERLDRALAGDTAPVGIVGDAGIGKTRLIEEFLRRIQPHGYSVHRGFNESYGAVAPLQPFKQILRDLGDTTAEQAQGAKLARLLSELTMDWWRQQKPAEAVAQVLGEAFVAISSHSPVVVFIDDWQWADDASRQVLKMLSDELEGKPVMLLVASRELDPSDPCLREPNTRRLSPFDANETRQAIKALLPGWFDLGLADQIYEQSGGNPFFVEELCKSDEEWTPNSFAASDGRTLPVPDWLYGVIRTRVEQLPPEQVRLVHIAAVVGNVVPRWLLEDLSGLKGHDDLIKDLATSDLLYTGEEAETLRFKHGITREVVYQSVGLVERRQYHRRIARALQSRAETGLGELYEVLAYHYAGAADPSQAARFAELAGDKAMATSSLDRARRQYRAALVALDGLMNLEGDVAQDEVYQKWREVMMRWALAIVYSPSRDQLMLLQRAIERAAQRDNKEALAWAEYWSGFVLYSLGDLPRSIPHLQRADNIAHKSGNSKLATQVVAALGHCYAAAGRYDEAIARLDAAIATKRKYSGGSLSVTLAYSMMCRAMVLADQGHFGAAERIAAESVAAVEGSGHEVEGSILAVRAAIWIWQGKWQQAISDARKARAVALRVSGPYVFAMAHALEGYARWKSDLDTDGIEMLRQAIGWLEKWDMRLYLSLAYGWLADALATAGLANDARRFAGRALWRARKLDRLGECEAYRALARMARTSNRALAESYLNRSLAAAEARGSARDEAITVAALGSLRGDAELTEEANSRPASMKSTPHVGHVPEGLERAGRPYQASGDNR